MYSVKDMYYSTMYSFCRNIFPTDLLKHPVKSLCHDGNPLAFCCFGETAWVLVSQVTTHVAPQPQNYSHTSHFLLQENREGDRERGVRRPLETMRAILIMKDRCPKPRLIFGRSRAAVWELQRNLGVGLLCCLKKCSSWLGLSHVPI